MPSDKVACSVCGKQIVAKDTININGRQETAFYCRSCSNKKEESPNNTSNPDKDLIHGELHKKEPSNIDDNKEINCPNCGKELTEEDIVRNGKRPHLGWEYYLCSECNTTSRTNIPEWALHSK